MRTSYVNDPRALRGHHRFPDPFASLPPEMCATIVRMAMRSGPVWNKYQHDFLVGSIARVSKQFKDLAAMKPLWQGEVFIRGNGAKIRDAIQWIFLSAQNLAQVMFGVSRQV